MNTDNHIPHLVTLNEVLMLHEKVYKLGWNLDYQFVGEHDSIRYCLYKLKTSARRYKREVELNFDKIDLVCGFAALLESGIKEKVIFGAVEESPTIETYVAVRNRLGYQGCILRAAMDFDRMAIGYRVYIEGNVLLLNQWEAVVEFANYLDRGAPHKALVAPTASNQGAKERIEA